MGIGWAALWNAFKRIASGASADREAGDVQRHRPAGVSAGRLARGFAHDRGRVPRGEPGALEHLDADQPRVRDVRRRGLRGGPRARPRPHRAGRPGRRPGQVPAPSAVPLRDGHLRWARHGATVTGADFSEDAVAAARALAARMGVPATFVQSDLYDLPATPHGPLRRGLHLARGAGWLPDLDRWARVIAHFLAPGGVFCIVDAHPLLQIFDDRVAHARAATALPVLPRSRAPPRGASRLLQHAGRGDHERRARLAAHPGGRHRGARARRACASPAFDGVPVPRVAVLPVDGARRRRLVAATRGPAAAPGPWQPASHVSLKAVGPA